MLCLLSYLLPPVERVLQSHIHQYPRHELLLLPLPYVLEPRVPSDRQPNVAHLPHRLLGNLLLVQLLLPLRSCGTAIKLVDLEEQLRLRVLLDLHLRLMHLS